MSSITALVAAYVGARERRLQLEKEADEIKKGQEAELSAQILQLMAAQGLKSANVEGIGRVVCKETPHYEIQDIESLAFQMLKMMVDSAKNGRPLSDGLLLQRRVHRENLDTLIDALASDDEPANEQIVSGLGVKKVVKVGLSFTKA